MTLGATKNANFNFVLKQKLDHHSRVDFQGDSVGDGFKAQKSIIDVLIDPNLSQWPQKWNF